MKRSAVKKEYWKMFAEGAVLLTAIYAAGLSTFTYWVSVRTDVEVTVTESTAKSRLDPNHPRNLEPEVFSVLLTNVGSKAVTLVSFGFKVSLITEKGIKKLRMHWVPAPDYDIAPPSKDEIVIYRSNLEDDALPEFPVVLTDRLRLSVSRKTLGAFLLEYSTIDKQSAASSAYVRAFVVDHLGNEYEEDEQHLLKSLTY